MHRSKSMLLVAFILVAVVVASVVGGGVWAKSGGGAADRFAPQSTVLDPSAQPAMPPGQVAPPCTPLNLNLNTGQATWSLVSQPSSSTPATAATVVNPYPLWFTLSSGSWISLSGSNINGPDGTYIYETTFTIGSQYGSALLSIAAYAADNQVQLALDGAPIGVVAGFSNSYTFTSPVGGPLVVPVVPPIIGAHTLQATVTNILPSPSPTGLLVEAKVTADCAPSPGRIIVDKVTIPAGATDTFTFTASYPPGSFSLTDIAVPNSSGPLPPATYTVSENTPSGWTLTSAKCSDGSPVSAIVLNPGESVTCTFTNTKKDVPPPPPTTYIYSVKIVCGTVTPPRPKPSIPTLRDPAPVVPGLYRTAVNIHNFWEKETTFLQKVAIALPQDQERGPITKKVKENLRPNEAVEVDCYNVVAILAGTTAADAQFLKGFVVIESPVELEVTAVYTAEELQENGISIDVEQIQPHVIRQGGAGPTGPAIISDQAAGWGDDTRRRAN